MNGACVVQCRRQRSIRGWKRRTHPCGSGSGFQGRWWFEYESSRETGDAPKVPSSLLCPWVLRSTQSILVEMLHDDHLEHRLVPQAAFRALGTKLLDHAIYMIYRSTVIAGLAKRRGYTRFVWRREVVTLLHAAMGRAPACILFRFGEHSLRSRR